MTRRWPELLVITAFALALSVCARVYRLGEADYWLDEMVSLHFAKHESWRSIFWDNNPPLYHGLLKAWVRFFGDGEAATRSLSVLFSMGTTAALVDLGAKLGGLPGAVLCGALHAVSAVSIAYARETRMYALFELCVAINLTCFLSRSPARRLGYWLSAACMALSHYLAVVPLLTQALIAVVRGRRGRAATVLGAATLGLALLTCSYLNFFRWDSLSWQRLKFELEPASRWPVATLMSLANDSILVAGVSLLAIVAAFWFGRNDEADKRVDRLTLAALVIVPVVVVFLIGAVTRRSVSLPRYWIHLVPPLTILVALSVLDLGAKFRREVALVLFAAILGGTAVAAPRIYLNRKEPWKSVARLIEPYPGSLVLTSRTIALRTPYFEKAGIEVMKWDPTRVDALALLRREVDGRGRVWIVENYWGGIYMPSLSKSLASSYKISDVSASVDDSSPIRIMLVEKR